MSNQIYVAPPDFIKKISKVCWNKRFIGNVLFLLFLSLLGLLEADNSFYQNDKMISEQIIARGISDKRVIEAMRRVDRRLFVSFLYRQRAYYDGPLPIGHDQTISQPYIVAYMTEALELNSDDVVLEIGTGSGYQAAILAEIVKQVYTIEIIEPLAREAQERLMRLGYKNIEVKYGDGYKGWPEHAPFDKIIVTAAPEDIPEELINQLKVGGKMILPAGAYFQRLYLITKTAQGFDKKPLIPVIFVPMVHGD